MSEQFKVGDIVRYTQEAIDCLGDEVEAFVGHDLCVLELSAGEQEGDVDVVYLDIQTGRQDWCASEHLELVPVPAPGDGSGLKGPWIDPLKAEKAVLLSRVSEIDKQIEAEAQGDDLSRLKAIVTETGYFSVGHTYWQFDPESQQSDYSIPAIGYGFDSTTSNCITGTYAGCWFGLESIEDFSSIPRERFEKARAAYEAIVQKVKEAMEP